MQEVEIQTMRLNGALSAVGVTSKDAQEDVWNLADSYSSLGFAGEDALSAMASLVTATGSVDQSTKLLALSADFARTRQISLADASRVLQMATMGNLRAFKQLGITLDESLPKNKAIAKAFDELNQRIGGTAVKYTETFAGRVAVLKEQIGGLVEAIGMRVLPILTAMLGYISENGTALLVYGGIVLGVVTAIKTYGATMAAIKAIQQAYAFWTYAQAASTNIFKFAMYGLNAAIKANPIGFLVTALIALGMAFVWAWNKFEGFRKGIVKGLQIIINAFGYLVGMVGTALNALGKIPSFGWAKEAGKSVDGLANKVRDYSNSLDSLANKKINTPNISGFVAPGKDTGIEGNVAGGDVMKGAGGSGSTTVQNITVYASNTNDIERKMAKAAKLGVPVGTK
jgi:hypothetical protein